MINYNKEVKKYDKIYRLKTNEKRDKKSYNW